jgi:hypothetical protein
MEQNETVFQAITIDSSGQGLLQSSGKWARFIGLVYLILAALLILITILLIANLQTIADAFMHLNGISNESMAFMMGAGKWLFAMSMALSTFILALNGLFLVRYGMSTKQYALHMAEVALENSFQHLSNYLILTTLLSVLSTVMTIAAIVFYLIR